MFQSPTQCRYAPMAVAMHNSVIDTKAEEQAQQQQGKEASLALRLKQMSTDSLGENDSPKSVLHAQESTTSESNHSSLDHLPEAKKAKRILSRPSMTTFIREDWVECYASCTVEKKETVKGGRPSSGGATTSATDNNNSNNDSMRRRRDALWFEDTVAPRNDKNCSCSSCQSQITTASAATPPTSSRDLPLEMSVLMEQMALQIEDSIESQQQQQQQESGSNRLSHRDSQLSLSSLCNLDRLSSDFLTSQEDVADSDSESQQSDIVQVVEEMEEDIIDNEDMLLNNMERQWHGKDYLMEHIGTVAAMKSQDGESLPSQHYESF